MMKNANLSNDPLLLILNKLVRFPDVQKKSHQSSSILSSRT